MLDVDLVPQPLGGQAGHGQGLGGVLGDVVRHRLVVQRLTRAGQVVTADGPHIGALRRAERQRDSRASANRLDEADGGGSPADGIAQHPGVDARRRGLVVLAGGIQADDGVEVDDAAGLVFGHLDIADPDQGAEPFLGDAQAAGELAGQVDDEPAP